MKKKVIKVLCVILAVILLITAIIAIGLGIISLKGYGFTQGKLLITATGSYMLIDENNSPIVMSNQTEKDLFADLSSGDEILILHDGIQESYPAGTGVYYCKKLSEGKAEDINTAVIESLTELGWIEKEIKRTQIECVGNNYKFSIIIPDDWKYEKSPDTIKFCPVNKDDGQIVFQFDDSFGVCGTGLESKTVYLGEYAGNMGTYDNDKKWSFIVIDHNYIIINQSGDWWSEYEDEVMEILNTIEIE